MGPSTGVGHDVRTVRPGVIAMVPMPYILVNIVLDYAALALLCVTSAMLLYRHFARRGSRPASRFISRLLWVTVLALLVALVARTLSFLLQRYAHVSRFTVSDVCALVGTVNAVVLAYGFMNRRCFLDRPGARRRLLLGALSVLVTLIPITLIAAVVTALFVIR